VDLILHNAQPMIALLHSSTVPHSHPDQLAVALVVSLAIVATSWMLERKRS